MPLPLDNSQHLNRIVVGDWFQITKRGKDYHCGLRVDEIEEDSFHVTSRCTLKLDDDDTQHGPTQRLASLPSSDAAKLRRSEKKRVTTCVEIS